MIQFREYPIRIIYSRHTQEHVDKTIAEFYMAGDHKMYDWMTTVGRYRMELVEDSAPAHRQEAVTYERLMKKQMDAIFQTEVGRCLLNALNPKAKIYILTNPKLKNKALTMQTQEKEGGGIRIYIDPRDWMDTLDDTLIHELTHALRFSYDRMFHRPIGHPDFMDAEEFYATQISNIYRSSLGKTQLYGSYNEFQEGHWSSKGTIYAQFVDAPLLIMALKYFFDQEPLTAQVSRFPYKQPDFNPFRDYATLERMAVGKLQQPGMRAGKLMPL